MRDDRLRAQQQFVVQWGTVVFVLFLISALAAFWIPLSQSVRVVFGLWFTLFVPGYVWSHVFWKKQTIDPIERIAISLVLSMTVVSLTTFLLHRIGIRVSLLSSVSTVAAYVLLGIVAVGIRSRIAGPGKTPTRT